MRIRFTLLIALGAGAFSSGCTVSWNAARTVVIEPSHFPTYAEDCLLKRRAHKLAGEAWSEVVRDTKGAKLPEDYHKGFVEGFADYLENGGTGEPPALPPRHYWGATSPEGRLAVAEWFGGFRHGASLAKLSGVRDFVVVPASSPRLNTEIPPQRAQVSATVPNQVAPVIPNDLELPPPREVEAPSVQMWRPKSSLRF
jgi:hypothetical protein